MQTQKNNAPVAQMTPDMLDDARQNFVSTFKEAGALGVASNAGAAFEAAGIVVRLRSILTDQVMEAVFMPLMNTHVGFVTDRDPSKVNKKTGDVPQPYSISVVRDAIIDAAFMGLLPTGNQFNIISGRMYPTKEGFTSLLRRLGAKYFITKTPLPDVSPSCAAVCCKVSYEYQGEKNSFTITATVKKDGYSSMDQIKGKAERQAKKVLYEYLTGCDLGEVGDDLPDADEQQAQVRDAVGQKKDAMRTSETGAPKLL